MDDVIKVAIALYERSRFAEFMHLSEDIQDADVLCLRALVKNNGMGCAKNKTGAEMLRTITRLGNPYAAEHMAAIRELHRV